MRYIYESNISAEHLESDLWAGAHHCPICNDTRDFHLKFTYEMPNPFPHVDPLCDRFIYCDKCGYINKIKISQYKEIHTKQFDALVDCQYPREKIIEDFPPEKLSLRPYVISLIVSSIIPYFVLWFIIIFILAFSAKAGFSGTLIAVCFALFLSFPAWIPFLSALKHPNCIKQP